MIYTPQTHQCWHERDRASHDKLVHDYLDAGWSLIALNISGDPANPSYAAAVAKPGVASGTQAFSHLTFAEFQQKFLDMAAAKMGCYLISATGPVGSAVYAAAFRPMAQTPLTRHQLSRETFDALNLQAQQDGAILLTADVFGTAAAPSFCAVWGPNPGQVAWNAQAVDVDPSEAQQRYDASTSARARMALVAAMPSGHLLEMYVDSRIGKTASRGNLSAAEYQQQYDLLAKQGLFPVSISADGSGGARRYHAIWATTDEVKPRKWNATGPGPAVPDIDSAVQKFMQAHRLRGAALAVCKGTRLLYTRGYTWAEDDHPTMTPTTRFRLASVSKTFAAVAIWRLIQQGRLSLDTKLGDVLAIRQPDGSPAKVNQFGSMNQVTIQHLLESRSGIEQSWDVSVQAVAMVKGATLPCRADTLLQYLATRELTGTPGDTDNTVYGNIDYLLLGLVLAARQGSSVIDALHALVLDPLQLKNTGLARSLVGDQDPHETPYHVTAFQRPLPDLDPKTGQQIDQADTLDPIRIWPSRVTPGTPLQPVQYGGEVDYELMSTCGGLSASAVDVARLYAMFSCRWQNPVLTTDSIFQMEFWAALASAGHRGPDGERSHGYHGFDGVYFPDITHNVASISKGGYLRGMGSEAFGWTGPDNFSYVLLYNGNAYAHEPTKWFQAADGTGVGPASWAKNQGGPTDWGATDLFVSEYHLPVMVAEAPPGAPKTAPPSPPPKMAPATFDRLLQGVHAPTPSADDYQRMVQRSMGTRRQVRARG